MLSSTTSAACSCSHAATGQCARNATSWAASGDHASDINADAWTADTPADDEDESEEEEDADEAEGEDADEAEDEDVIAALAVSACMTSHSVAWSASASMTVTTESRRARVILPGAFRGRMQRISHPHESAE